MAGWIKILRDDRNRFPWTSNDPFDCRSAYLDLIMMAYFKDTDIPTKHGIVHAKRGQVYTTIVYLAKKWKWSRNKVYRYIGTLVGTSLVTTDGTPDGTLITLIEYEIMQSGETPLGTSLGTPLDTTDDTTDGTPLGTTDGTQYKNVYKNVNKKVRKNVEKDILVDPAEELFNELWELYPRKMGKSSISKKTKQEIYKIGFDRMAAAIEKYKKKIDREGTKEEYIMYGSTFFNTRYADFLEPEKPIAMEKPKEKPPEKEERELTDDEWAAL